MPFHSILIAGFNRFDYLRATVESCLSSSDSDFEILIVDDASDPLYADPFYDHLMRLDVRIRVIRHSINQGVGSRFVELHREARGKLLHLIGSDDLCHPERLLTSRLAMQKANNHNAILCSKAKQLSYRYQLVPDSPGYVSSCAIKVGMFFQPLVLHPTVTTWHPDISSLIQYRERMRAAVDYCFYVDNYFRSSFISLDKCLVYLVHSASGITRDRQSRCNQLAMHDYAMHRLWSHFAECSIADVAAIRSIVVTNEYPQVDLLDYDSRRIKALLALLLSVKKRIVSCSRGEDSEINFNSFIKTEGQVDDFIRSVDQYFGAAERSLALYLLTKN